MQQLTLVECRHNSGERYDASLGEHRQASAAGELTLLNEEGDAVLQITIGGVHGKGWNGCESDHGMNPWLSG